MKAKLAPFLVGVASASVLSASLATAAPAPAQIITDVAGAVRIQQHVPCGDLVDVTTSITEGRMEITPQMTSDGVLFDLTRLDTFLSPFSVERTCRGLAGVANFSEIGVRLAGAVRFRGYATSSDRPHLYRFVIPKESFLIFESVRDNSPVRQPETAYQRPAEDVTGLIELAVAEGAIVIKKVKLHVALATQLRFRAGCVADRCLIDEIDGGTQTSDVVATVRPDTTPPTVACTRVDSPLSRSSAPATNSAGASRIRFRSSATDNSGAAVIRLGTYVLGNGEVFRLKQTSQAGVRLRDRAGSLRRFLVGRGDNFIAATDPAGNISIAYCR